MIKKIADKSKKSRKLRKKKKSGFEDNTEENIGSKFFPRKNRKTRVCE